MDFDTKVTVLITMVTTLIASSGFWSYLISRSKSNNATTRLMMGLAYDRIVQLGMTYIERGFITKDEYEDFRKYFYEPYKELGGNGTADRIMSAISELPIHSGEYQVRLKKQGE